MNNYKSAPERLVDQQLECYNALNLKGFLDTFHEEISIYNLIDGAVILSGKEALTVRYEKHFKAPKTHVTVVKRMVIDNKIIDHETIRKSGSDEIVNNVVIYLVEADQIKTVWLIY